MIILPGEYVNGVPVVTATVILTRLKLLAPVMFVIDTGAHATALHRRDVRVLRITTPAQLDDCAKYQGRGVGGGITYYKESAIVRFPSMESFGRKSRKQRRGIYDWDGEVSIADPNTPVQQDDGSIPAILGRDFLNGISLQANGHEVTMSL